ncbi:hypothetical protein ACW7BJ_33225 [Azospirillum argentinense]
MAEVETGIMGAESVEDATPLSLDMLDGARAIAKEMFGDPTKSRRVHYLHDKGGTPIVKMGGRLMARRSVLRKWWEMKEAEALGTIPEET